MQYIVTTLFIIFKRIVKSNKELFHCLILKYYMALFIQPQHLQKKMTLSILKYLIQSIFVWLSYIASAQFSWENRYFLQNKYLGRYGP